MNVRQSTLGIALLAVILVGSSGPATGSQYPITGNARFQIGGRYPGWPIPFTFGPVPGGKIYAQSDTAIIQASKGPDPRRITIPKAAFHHPGSPPWFLPLYGANNNIWQVMTQINVTLPMTPMRPGGVLLNVLQEDGRTGPPNVTWCPGQPLPNVTYNPNCTKPKSYPTAGLLRYRKTANQFGGPISARFGGLVDLALRLGGAGVPCNFTTTTCQAYFGTWQAYDGLCPPLQTGVIGAPFGRWHKATGPAPSPGRFNIRVPYAGGTITYMTPTGFGFGQFSPVSSWGGPWTTGQIINSVWTPGPPPGTERFTQTGSDNRVNGVGVISLIAGSVSNRLPGGPTANRGWLNITVPEPAAAVSAASALLLLLGCHILVSRRSR